MEYARFFPWKGGPFSNLGGYAIKVSGSRIDFAFQEVESFGFKVFFPLNGIGGVRAGFF